jgi:nucleoside-diphosphate-sugar epimerase
LAPPAALLLSSAAAPASLAEEPGGPGTPETRFRRSRQPWLCIFHVGRAMPNEASKSGRTALVIGPTGGIGRAAAEALCAHGWRVTAIHRDPERARGGAPGLGGVEWVKADAMNRAELCAAAEGAAVIFHGANPPRYRRWRELAIPMLANAIAAARAAGARLIFPGNLYNFGPDAGALIDEEAPQHPTTRKGAVRVEMEKRLAAAAMSGAPALVIRAGDFLGDAAGSWFRAAMIKPGGPVRSITYPGKPEIGHAWAYLPDLAETVARLADIEQHLSPFEVFHFGGHWLEPGIEIAYAVRRVTGNPELPIRVFPWLAVILAAPFVPFMHELAEMRYLWRLPLRLDNRKLVALLGEEPHTPLDEAVAQTLRRMKVLPASEEERSRSAAGAG